MHEELIMLDEESSKSDDSDIVVVLSNCTFVNNVLTIPKKYALRLAANIITQVDLGNG